MTADDTRRSDGQGLSGGERELLTFAMCAPDPDRAPVTEIQLLHLYAAVESILAARGGNTDNTHVVHVTATPVAEDVVWCDDCEEWVTAGTPEGAPTDLAQTMRTVAPTCSDPDCPIYKRHRGQGRTYPPHGQHDFRAALDAAPAPTECPSACGRNEPCADRWHDDQRRLTFPAARTDEPCIAPPGNLCTDTGCWDADRCIVRTAPTDNQRDDGLAERVRALADEWASEGDDLIRNCYSGRDVNEGEQLKSCAAALRAVVDGATTGDGEGA